MPSDPRLWIGFDLGGTKMLCHVFDSDFNLLARQRERTRGHRGAERGVGRIVDTIEDAIKDLKIERVEVAGIGIGCPGPLDLDEGIIINAPNLGWSDVHIRKVLEEHFGCPAFIMNDVDAGVYGEYRFGAGRNARCLLGVFPGTGIGGGCVYNGEILRGSKGSCMEVGHMQVDPTGPLCGCGRRGCLEAVASRLAISANAIKAAYRGNAPYLMENYGADLSRVRSKALAESIKHGDEAVANIVEHAAQMIGQVVGNLVNVILPDVIVLGGGLVAAMPTRFLNPVRAAAAARAMPAFVDSFEIVAAKLNDESAVMGTAAWAQYQVDEKVGV